MGRIGFSKNSRMICAPLVAQSVEQILNDMHQAKMQGADVVEIRLDYISDFDPLKDLKLLLDNKPIPVVVVCRYASWLHFSTKIVVSGFSVSHLQWRFIFHLYMQMMN